MNQKRTYRKSEYQLAALARLRLARRSAMYLMRTLLLVTAGAMVCIAAFLTAERTSNLYILVTEGMAMRASCILENEPANDLQEYFTLPFIAEDAALYAGTYANYTIVGTDYDLAVSAIHVLPWSTAATLRAMETVNIKGSINMDQLSETDLAADFPLPAWPTRLYDIHFTYVEGRWFIDSLTVVDDNPQKPVLNTPNPDLTPRPMATPTPEPTDVPLP